MKKKAKKLTLSKETVRRLTADLGKVKGGWASQWCTSDITECTACPTERFSNCLECDAQETVHPPCTA